MRLEAMAVKIPYVEGHPNRVDFEGVLTVVNTPSDKAPAGARGHRVILTREAAEKALPSLLGMAVDYRPGWDGHDARRKCGIITQADVEANRLRVSGYLFGKDFPEVEECVRFRRVGGIVTQGDQRIIEDGNIYYADPELFNIFSFDCCFHERFFCLLARADGSADDATGGVMMRVGICGE